jgi:hypothetical protein
MLFRAVTVELWCWSSEGAAGGLVVTAESEDAKDLMKGLTPTTKTSKFHLNPLQPISSCKIGRPGWQLFVAAFDGEPSGAWQGSDPRLGASLVAEGCDFVVMIGESRFSSKNCAKRSFVCRREISWSSEGLNFCVTVSTTGPSRDCK